MIHIELTEEDAELFKQFQKEYYFYRPLKKEMDKYPTREGYLTFHFTKLGEVGTFDVVEKFQHFKVILPV